MQCFVCGRDGSKIESAFEEIAKNFKSQIAELDKQLNETRDAFAQENGFMKENIIKLHNINDSILAMKINAFMENEASFLKLDNNLEILSNYIKKYHPQISENANIRQLVQMFENEPNEPKDHKYHYQSMQLSGKKKLLENAVEIIEKKQACFYEIEVPSIFASTGLGYQFTETLKHYLPNGEELVKPQKIFLCHYCNYLFTTSAQAAYKSIHAHDYDGDDDDIY
jgi:hypothetical protein